MMLYIRFVYLSLFMRSVFCIFMSLRRQAYINNICSVEISHPLKTVFSTSIENMIALIEKIEESPDVNEVLIDSNGGLTANKLALALLYGFRADFPLNGSGFKKVDLEMFENNFLNYQPKKREDELTQAFSKILTKEEECILYMSISPFILKKNGHQNRGYEMNSKYNNYRDIEQGVVSFRNNPKHAIATKYLLLGIVSAFNKLKTSRPMEKYSHSENFNYEDSYDRDTLENIDPVLGATIGSLYVLTQMSEEDTKFGLSGKWDNTLCPQKYYIESGSAEDGTLAHFRGAIDGYNIGKMIKAGILEDLPLSKILRNYYYGFTGITSWSIDYCHRDGISISPDLLNKTTVTLIKEFSEINRKNIVFKTKLMSELNKIFTNAKKPEDNDWCQMQTYSSGLEESLLDVLVVVDSSENRYLKHQIEIIEELGKHLDLGKNKGSISLLLLNRNDTGEDMLKALVWKSTNSFSIGCLTNSIEDIRPTLSLASSEFFDLLNSTINNLDKGVFENNAVPGRPVIIFGKNMHKIPDKIIKSSVRYFRQANPFSPLIIIGGKKKEELIDYVQDRKFIIDDIEDPTITGENIAKVLKKMPATFQFDCKDVSTEYSLNIEAYISPGKKQYWAIYPKHFFYSQYLEMEFKADSGEIEKICFSRRKDPEKYGICIEKSDQFKFHETSLCKDKTLFTCQPLYFMVQSTKENVNSNLCLDKKCANLNQFKFTFIAVGMTCSFSFALTSSFTTMIFILIAIWRNLSDKL